MEHSRIILLDLEKYKSKLLKVVSVSKFLNTTLFFPFLGRDSTLLLINFLSLGIELLVA